MSQVKTESVKMKDTPQTVRLSASIMEMRFKMGTLKYGLGNLKSHQEKNHVSDRFKVIATRISTVVHEIKTNLLKVVEEIANLVGGRVWDQTVTLLKHITSDLGRVGRSVEALRSKADPRKKEEPEWNSILAIGGNMLIYHKCQTDPLRGKDNSAWIEDHSRVIAVVDFMRESLEYTCAQLERVCAPPPSETGSE